MTEYNDFSIFKLKAEKNVLHDVRTSRKIIFGLKDHATLLGDRVTLPYRRNVKSLEYVDVIKCELGDFMMSYHHGHFLNFKLENVDKNFFFNAPVWVETEDLFINILQGLFSWGYPIK